MCVFSKYSPGWATGTGTDQMAVACRKQEGFRLTGAGKHTKLGELVGRAVKSAVQAAMTRQNGLVPSARGAVWIWTRRYGIDRPELIRRVKAQLSEKAADLFEKNADSLLKDPPVVARGGRAVSFSGPGLWGVLPHDTVAETPAGMAGLLAASISGKPEKTSQYAAGLSSCAPRLSGPAMVDLVCRALAWGLKTSGKKRKNELYGPAFLLKNHLDAV